MAPPIRLPRSSLLRLRPTRTAFAGARPWKTGFDGVRHAVWASDPRFADGAPLAFTTGSLRGPGFAFTLRGKLDEPAHGDGAG